MLGLSQSLQRQDPGYLRIVADLWGIELEPGGESEPALRDAAQILAVKMLDPVLVREMVEALPELARAALYDLLQNGGSLPWSHFTRRYGSVREMGPGKRDREQPFLNPASPAEALWYRGLLGRAFQDTPDGPQEFAYIPSDIVALLPTPLEVAPRGLGRPASPAERAVQIPADDSLVDHACTLLAALRLGISLESKEFMAGSWNDHFQHSPTATDLQILLASADLLDIKAGLPQPEAARQFLEAPRESALAQLTLAWLQSRVFNDLLLLPGLRAEGDWQNDPLRARQAILQLLSGVPRHSWWSLPAFITAVKEAQPDFQRPAGDYDSWYIYDLASGNFLRGFDNWERVDGALITFIITGPLHWLGILDLAAPASGGSPTAFRFSSWSEALLHGTPPDGFSKEEENLLVSSDARLRVPRLISRAVRYQVARFSTWERADETIYSYRITHASLLRAREQGIQVSHIIALLRRHALSLSPNLVKALQRWEQQGSEARLEHALILRLRTPEMLQSLRSSRAARFLGDPLGPTVVIVKPGAWEKLSAILAEMGFLAEGTEGE